MLKLLSGSRRAVILPLLIVCCAASWSAHGEAPPEETEGVNATSRQLLLQFSPGKLNALQQRHGFIVMRQRAHHLALVKLPEDADTTSMMATLLADTEALGAERATVASLPSDLGAALSLPSPRLLENLQRQGTTSRRCLAQRDLEALWSGYTDQWSLEVSRLAEAQMFSPNCGEGIVVAVIDTGVDPQHPALAEALLPGYDFLLQADGQASEWSAFEPHQQNQIADDLRATSTQSVQQILEGDGEIVILDSALGIILNPSTSTSLDGQPLDTYFGHGTMVAGLVRLAAPGASIMPLRVFDGSGSASLYDIIDAIYYAVDHGAHVINMSFSMDESSKELRRAIRYARDHGVVTVAAAGNSGTQAHVFPAAYPGTVGVASTTENDLLSDFSNYGASLVKLGAPGDGVVSAFPGDHYAAGWGTSFAAPLVAGTVALVLPLYAEDPNFSRTELLGDLYQGAHQPGLNGMLGRGRLDALGALMEFAQQSNP